RGVAGRLHDSRWWGEANLATWMCRCSRAVALQQPLHVPGQDVRLEVDAVARGKFTERGHLQGVRNERDLEPVVGQRGHGEAHAGDRDRTLLHQEAAKRGGSADAHAGAVALRLAGDDLADAVDVALDDVAAERLAGAQRVLEVDAAARAEPAERGAGQRL